MPPTKRNTPSHPRPLSPPRGGRGAPPPAPRDSSPGPEAPVPLWDRVDGFERLLEHRTRLGTCVLLARYEALSFTRLRELLAETDGSLGANLGKLEGAGLLSVDKSFENRRPITWYRLTPAGRRALAAHLAALAQLVSAAAPDPR